MIGRAFRDDRRRGAIALALALGLVAMDFVAFLFHRFWTPQDEGPLLVVVLAAVFGLWRFAGRDFDSLGLRARPEPSWRFWIGAGALIGLAVGVIVASYLLATGTHVAFDGPDEYTWRFGIPQACLFAPVYEELVFRVALCSTLVPWIGRWPTIVVSGAVFGAVHFAYGNPGPDNFVAGYFFAWAYLRSGSVAVPIALHASGNLIVMLLNPRF